ncbi:MAG: sulfite exporter TauE/SafE family protein [Firmicutes bacterium]|nr:sulfite exporter TauE/SafE family protein [Bacillota bacterium]
MGGEIPVGVEAVKAVALTPKMALELAVIGLLGGTLSGFLGSGGAFIMTPAMMSLGIPGIMAVAANITHKFGKAIQGAKKHSEFGNVDKKMGLVMFLALFLGVKLAVMANTGIAESMGAAGSNLYISAFFVVVLTALTLFMAKDILRHKKGIVDDGSGGGIAEKIRNLNLPPIMNFPIAKTKVSLWIALFVGLATGFLAGTIGVGGFIGVPAMIYLLGCSTYVAAGTELFLAIFSGAQGAYLYAMGGFTDIRIALLLYVGSMIGIQLGAIGTRIVRGYQIKLVMTSIIAMVVVSRGIMIPSYLTDLGYMSISEGTAGTLNMLSNVALFGSGIIGVMIIFFWMIQALRRADKGVTAEEKQGDAVSSH